MRRGKSWAGSMRWGWVVVLASCLYVSPSGRSVPRVDCGSVLAMLEAEYRLEPNGDPRRFVQDVARQYFSLGRVPVFVSNARLEPASCSDDSFVVAAKRNQAGGVFSVAVVEATELVLRVVISIDTTKTNGELGWVVPSLPVRGRKTAQLGWVWSLSE